MSTKRFGFMFFVIFFGTYVMVIFAKENADLGLNVKQLITKNGYPFETYTVLTEDGYILEAHRIPYGKKNNNLTSRPPVLLMPGLASDSAVFISSGPENALGYILADSGYDVWLANYRGTTWSRNHTKLNPNTQKRFWDYSAHEIGYYDTSAFIDRILNVTEQNQLFYIGHSQGSMVIYILTSEKPEYNNKIRLMILLAPGSFIKNSKSAFFPVFFNFRKEILKILNKLHIYEVFPQTSLTTMIIRTLCDPEFAFRIVCDMLVFAFNGKSAKPIDKEKMLVNFNNSPAGASVKQFVYFMQLYTVDRVFKYDYGKVENLIRYGQYTPPAYNLSEVTAPSAFYYGDSDSAIDSTDSSTTADMFPNVVAKVLLKGFSHVDFLFGVDARDVLYNNMIDLMRRF